MNNFSACSQEFKPFMPILRFFRYTEHGELIFTFIFALEYAAVNHFNNFHFNFVKKFDFCLFFAFGNSRKNTEKAYDCVGENLCAAWNSKRCLSFVRYSIPSDSFSVYDSIALTLPAKKSSNSLWCPRSTFVLNPSKNWSMAKWGSGLWLNVYG